MNIYKQTMFKSTYYVAFFFFLFLFYGRFSVLCLRLFKARLIRAFFFHFFLPPLFSCAIATAVVFLCLIWHSSKYSDVLFIIITDVNKIKVCV